MEQTQTINQTPENNQDSIPATSPVTYPSRIYDEGSGAFVPNINMQESSDSLTTVALKNNEVVGFKDGTSVDQMEHAIASDQNGSIEPYKPTFYEKFIREPLASLGMDMFQPHFISDIKPSPERAFATSFARAATADVFKPDFSDQEAKAYPAQAFAGALVGSVTGFGTIGAMIDGIKLTALTPFAENLIKGGLTGGIYRGISDTSNELRDSDHPDLAKIGTGVLHDTLWWGGISGLVGAASKPVGVAASAGLGYLMAKSDGASEPDALLNGSVLAGFHMLQAHGEQQDVRDLVTNTIQGNIADYIKAKNPLVDEGVANLAAKEMVSNHAEDVVNEANQAILAKENAGPELGSTTKQTKTPPPDKPFTDPYDPKMMDYLSQYISPYQIVRMDGTSRIALANSPVKDLEGYATSHAELAQEEATGRSPIIEANADAARGISRNAIEEVAKSPTLTGELMGKIADQVLEPNDGGNHPEHKADQKENSNEGNEQLQTPETQQLQQEKLPQEGSLESQIESSSKESIPPEQGNFKPEEEPAPGTGETKKSGLSQSIADEAIQKGLTDDLGNLPEYQARDMKDIAKRVSDFIKKDPELAKKIAFGEAPEQDGLRAQELFTGLKSKAFAEGDVPLINELGTNQKAAQMATELGQRVKALDSGDPHDPIKIVQDIQKAISDKVSKSVKEQKNIVNKFKEAIKESAPKLSDWDQFIESIKC